MSFNAEQKSWMGYLNRVSAEELCWCGWNRRYECRNTEECKAGRSAAQKIAASEERS